MSGQRLVVSSFCALGRVDAFLFVPGKCCIMSVWEEDVVKGDTPQVADSQPFNEHKK